MNMAMLSGGLKSLFESLLYLENTQPHRFLRNKTRILISQLSWCLGHRKRAIVPVNQGCGICLEMGDQKRSLCVKFLLLIDVCASEAATGQNQGGWQGL